ncbi:Crp/Fnr family transcriptional regulator [Bifidobacterium longum]|uniref:Crp/Fnr family transcriptional regulator n=3 Tax=Bifidobacterium longum TaxID=216816 RepID=UPI0020C7E4BB|nr:Crp/Fnr family transcriptional regulator [Bifidobacterium longum]
MTGMVSLSRALMNMGTIHRKIVCEFSAKRLIASMRPQSIQLGAQTFAEMLGVAGKLVHSIKHCV